MRHTVWLRLCWDQHWLVTMRHQYAWEISLCACVTGGGAVLWTQGFCVNHSFWPANSDDAGRLVRLSCSFYPSFTMKNNKKVLITCTEEKHSLTFNAFLRFIHSFCFHMQTPGTFDQCGALGSWIIITSASNQSRCENHDDGVTSRKTVTAADLFARVSASEMTNVRQIPPVLILLPVAILKHVVTRRFWLANRDNEGSSCSSYSVIST